MHAPVQICIRVCMWLYMRVCVQTRMYAHMGIRVEILICAYICLCRWLRVCHFICHFDSSSVSLHVIYIIHCAITLLYIWCCTFVIGQPLTLIKMMNWPELNIFFRIEWCLWPVRVNACRRRTNLPILTKITHSKHTCLRRILWFDIRYLNNNFRSILIET